MNYHLIHATTALGLVIASNFGIAYLAFCG